MKIYWICLSNMLDIDIQKMTKETIFHVYEFLKDTNDLLAVKTPKGIYYFFADENTRVYTDEKYIKYVGALGFKNYPCTFVKNNGHIRIIGDN